ncbi:MAG: hypothetical protein AB7V59_00485 [Gammaproteobacteria bacterium]
MSAIQHVAFAGCLAVAVVTTAGPAPCSIVAGDLGIEARGVPDDGEWGPTLDIEVRDTLGPLTRLTAPETRPIEACWWANVDRDPAAEFVIGLGATGDAPAGARIYEWDGGHLVPAPLPALPEAGTFRFIVRRDRLWAVPVGPSQVEVVPAYRFDAGAWTAVGAAETTP